MKIKFVLLICLITNALSSLAQSPKISDGIKPYIAIVKTKGDKFKGLFVKIDSQRVLLYAKDQYQEVQTSDKIN